MKLFDRPSARLVQQADIAYGDILTVTYGLSICSIGVSTSASYQNCDTLAI